MQGTITEVVFHPKGKPPGIGRRSQPAKPAWRTGRGSAAQRGSRRPAPAFRRSFPPDIIIETLDVNMSGMEFNDAEQVRIRFYPNGISDEMRMILFDGRDRMGIELEITTGLANVVPDPLREWTRR